MEDKKGSPLQDVSYERLTLFIKLNILRYKLGKFEFGFLSIFA